jgi:acetate kinase
MSGEAAALCRYLIVSTHFESRKIEKILNLDSGILGINLPSWPPPLD